MKTILWAAICCGVFIGCGDKEKEPKKLTGPASTALEIANQGYAANKGAKEHQNTVVKAINLSHGQIEAKEPSRMYSSDDAKVKTSKVCYISWSHGTESGVVPNSRYDCEPADNDYKKKQQEKNKE